jgi:hypothetical protein
LFTWQWCRCAQTAAEAATNNNAWMIAFVALLLLNLLLIRYW